MPFMDHKGFSDHHQGKRVMTVEQFKLWLKTTFDTKNDGKISKEELRHAVRLTRGLLVSWSICPDFYAADTNHNGFIDDNEFKNLVHFADKHFNVKIKQS
ncbi:putative EF-hand domain pair protein [Medicago truncatula]|uniref:EF-hand pair protein n=1 Tax=Medicago truncatula TaxID=3880 RepID=G7J6C6_MEDTR|nr:EF-hand pair protein [Medicago truncatula]RHN70280.1 putative EF-hand domain pair protein [Medicago truncatula]